MSFSINLTLREMTALDRSLAFKMLVVLVKTRETERQATDTDGGREKDE